MDTYIENNKSTDKALISIKSRKSLVTEADVFSNLCDDSSPLGLKNEKYGKQIYNLRQAYHDKKSFMGKDKDYR